jgi:hypothetical protein
MTGTSVKHYYPGNYTYLSLHSTRALAESKAGSHFSPFLIPLSVVWKPELEKACGI